VPGLRSRTGYLGRTGAPTHAAPREWQDVVSPRRPTLGPCVPAPALVNRCTSSCEILHKLPQPAGPDARASDPPAEREGEDRVRGHDTPAGLGTRAAARPELLISPGPLGKSSRGREVPVSPTGAIT
jgi:hypothetical protein